jgi:predicted histidine transporter YuiF (NhaC family)
MKLENFNIKSIIAIIVIVFGMSAIVFVHIEDMALGAIIGFISMVLGYFFGSSKQSEAKDKTIHEMNSQSIIGDRPDDRK